MVVVFKQGKGRVTFGQVGGAMHHPAKTFSGAPDRPVMEKPVLVFHIREHGSKPGRQPVVMILHHRKNLLRKLKQRIFRELHFVRRQKMIVDHIHESTAVQTVMWPEYLPGIPCGFMRIREYINYTVQGDALLDCRGIIKFLFPFYKIADQVADSDARMVKRKICVGEVVD